MRQAGRCQRQAGEGIIGPDIAVDDQKRLRPHPRQRLEDAAAGFQRVRRFRGPGDADSPSAAIAQRRRQLFPQMAGVDHQIGDAGRPQGLEMVDDQRLTGHRQQGFGRVVGQRPHAFAAPGGQDHRLHDAGCQRSTPRTHSRSRRPANSG